jgi:uncharacterized membrane protein YebE (DUF533 family)
VEIVDSVALLYLACAQMTDGHLDDRELFEIHRQLGRLFPDRTQAELEERFAAVATQFWSMVGEPETLRELVDEKARLIAERSEPTRCEDVLAGLISVTEADEKVLEAERAWVAHTAEIFDVEVEAAAGRSGVLQRASLEEE